MQSETYQLLRMKSLSRFIRRTGTAALSAARPRRQVEQWPLDVQVSTRPGDSDNKGEIPEHQHATDKELPPFSCARRLVDERRQASKDENEVPYRTERHHHRFNVPHLTRMQKSPKQDRTRLDEVEARRTPDNSKRPRL